MAVAAVALVIAAGCHKPDDDLGLTVLDPNAVLGSNVIDTTTLVSWTREGATFNSWQVISGTTSGGLSRQVLGAYLDPDVGLLNTSIYAQLRLGTNDVGTDRAGHVLQCDSVVLCLAFDQTAYGYGNVDPQSFTVARLSQDLEVDSTYLNTATPAAWQEDLVAGASHLFRIDPTHKVVIAGDSLDPQLRIPLKNALGNELLQLWGGETLSDNDHFLDYFKGLRISPGEEPAVPYRSGAFYYSLVSGYSRLSLYYRDNTTMEGSLVFHFPINASSVRFTSSHFDHGRALQPGLAASLNDSTHVHALTYMQALGGLRTEVRFPYLDNYAASGLHAIAKAELVVPVVGDYFPLYPPPAQVIAFRKDTTGADAVLPDQLTTLTDIGGVYDATAHEYRLEITRWVQGVLSGTYPNTGLSLLPIASGVSANRAVLGGPGNAQRPMKLRLTFTTY